MSTPCLGLFQFYLPLRFIFFLKRRKRRKKTFNPYLFHYTNKSPMESISYIGRYIYNNLMYS